MRELLYWIALFVYTAATALSQCRGSHVTVSSEVHSAGSTLVGTVEAASFVPDSGSHLDGVNYAVRVDRIIHGKLVKASEVNIFSENSPEKFPMQVGKQYLLFVHMDDARYEVDNCGNSGMLVAAGIENAKQLEQYAARQ